MSTQKNGTNGTTPKPVQNGKPAPATVVTLIPAKEDKKPEPTVKGQELPELPPVEDRILKVSQLFSLVEKHEALLELRTRLKAFKLSTDGNGDNLRLMDSKGNTFQTSNSACIADVLDVLKATIERKISEVENQIRF